MKFISIIVIVLLLFQIFTAQIFATEPVILKHADELIGTSNEIQNTRTLQGNVQLQQGNVYVKCNSAIQYINSNKFLLKGNVVITQETLILESHSVLYDGNTYLAVADSSVYITDRKTQLTGKKGTYSTDKMIADFYDDVKLEDDSVCIYAEYINYDRKTTNSRAIGNVLVKGKDKNIFLEADTIDNFPQANTTIAFGNPVLFQIDTIKSLVQDFLVIDLDVEINLDVQDSIKSSHSEEINFDTLSIKSDTMIAFREKGNEKYDFLRNVEIVQNSLKAKAAKAIYLVEIEQIKLFSNIIEETNLQNFLIDSASESNNVVRNANAQTIIWLDSTQLRSDSVIVQLENRQLKVIHSYINSIAIMQNNASNLARIDQLFGNEIVLFIANDTLKKIESNGNAKSVFFSENNDEPDGVIVINSAEKIIIETENGKAENIILIKEIDGKFHPEQFVFGQEKEFYLKEFSLDFIDANVIPVKPEIRRKQP